jgi:uncharacterized protein
MNRAGNWVEQMMNSALERGEPGWYYRLGSYFKEQFGQPVYKIPLDAGFSCPNRDGIVGTGGCSYCYNPSFSPHHRDNLPLDLTEQLLAGKKKKPALYLAYFQSYTNTYAPLDQLKNLYDQALAVSEIIGLSIATRPDCLSPAILDLLEEYAKRCHLWVEFGLQSAHDKTLERINRGHNTGDFEKAVQMTRGRGIRVCAHIIIGLPGETPEMYAETIALINRSGIEGIKFHHLQVICNTPLAEEYRRGDVPVFASLADYLPHLCDCLELLSPDTVVQRLASQASSADLLIAPHWPESAGQIAAAVTGELIKRGTHQGCRF